MQLAKIGEWARRGSAVDIRNSVFAKTGQRR